MYKFSYCPVCGCSLINKKIESKNRLFCKNCKWVDYKNPKPVAVSVAKNKENKILLVKRNNNPGINKWSLPGGFIDFGETPEKAFLRELKEETGINGIIKNLLGVHIQKTKIYGSILIIAYEVFVNIENIKINSELKDAKFFDILKLPHIPFPLHIKLIKGE